MRNPFPHRSIALGVSALLLIAGVAQPAPASAAATVGPGTYEESSSAIQFTGSWQSLRSRGSSGGAIGFSRANASAALTFQGSNISWYTWHSKKGGMVDVYLDGVRVERVDNYSPARTTKVRGFTARKLDRGTHTIRIVASGAANPRARGMITHLDSFVVGEKTSKTAISSMPIRARDCPAATLRIRTSDDLTEALASARPGTVIELAPGTYMGRFALARSGTARNPIWVCGPKSAVVDGGGAGSGTAMRLESASHVRLTGFTVANALQGVMVKHSEDVAITDLHVHHTGDEGIHLYAFTTDSYVVGNLVEHTGVVNREYGEGIYIGTSGRRWNEVTNGAPDRSDRNTVARNTVRSTGAEGIDAKEGTSHGSILRNTVVGQGSGSYANAWIMVTGNDWYIGGNAGQSAFKNGYASFVSSDGAWGLRNAFRGNTGHEAPGSGVWIQSRRSGSTVSCDNWVADAAAGVTNVFCVP